MLLGANQSLSPVVTFMTLQFTLMARECFDALQNWSDEHSYVKVILAGRSSGEITDEEAAQKVLAEYFEKNPDHLPTSNGRPARGERPFHTAVELYPGGGTG